MKEKTIKFKSIVFDEISGDEGLIHNEYNVEYVGSMLMLIWRLNGTMKNTWIGEDAKRKIRELMN